MGELEGTKKSFRNYLNFIKEILSNNNENQSGQTIDQTNIILKVDFQIRLLLLDHSVQIEKTSEISGDGSKLQSNLFFVKEVLQIFHFLKIEIEHYILNESCTESSQLQRNGFFLSHLNQA